MNETYSKFSQYCIKKIGGDDVKVLTDVSEIELGIVYVSPYLLLKSANILDALNFKGYDCIVLYESPIIDVLSSFKPIVETEPSFSTLLIGFNNCELMKIFQEKKLTDKELYDLCKKCGYKVKTVFSNIMVKEKMKMFGVQYISEKNREKHLIDIKNFFKKCKI